MENYDQRMTFIEASLPPDPGANNVWTFPKLKPGTYGQIKVKVKTYKPKIEARIEGNAYGEGYTSTHGSGTHRSKEKIKYASSNLAAFIDIQAVKSPLKVNLSRTPLKYGDQWFASASMESGTHEALLRDRYLYARALGPERQSPYEEFQVTHKCPLQVEIQLHRHGSIRSPVEASKCIQPLLRQLQHIQRSK